MANLYQISTDLYFLVDIIADQGGEMTDEQEKQYDDLFEQLNTKAEGCAHVHQNISSEVDAVQIEIDRLKAKKTVMENGLKRFMDRVKETMEINGLDSLEAGIHEFKICKNGGKRSIEIDDESKIPQQFKKEVIETVIDKTLILEELASGGTVKGAVLLERGTHLRFK